MRHPWTAALGLAVLATVSLGHYAIFRAAASGEAIPASACAPGGGGGGCAAPCDGAAEACDGAAAPAVLGETSAPGGYWGSGQGFLGLSYGTALGFLFYVVAHAIARRRSGVAGPVFAGVTLTGGLWLAVCWLAGCCGSPLLPVYASIFGAKFLGLTSPIIFGVTVASVAVGAVWFHRACEKGCACAAPALGEGSGEDQRPGD